RNQPIACLKFAPVAALSKRIGLCFTGQWLPKLRLSMFERAEVQQLRNKSQRVIAAQTGNILEEKKVFTMITVEDLHVTATVARETGSGARSGSTSTVTFTLWRPLPRITPRTGLTSL